MIISDINISVDRDKCFACGLCVERCILDNLRLSVAPCRQACPIHMNCQGYIRLIAQGKEQEAANQMAPYQLFANILGRICSHPCETACERGRLDGAVHIRALKRYLADSYPDTWQNAPQAALDDGGRAAIVGSGPAGLMAAYELRRRGHKVIVFEAESEPGGLLRWVIPSFRLPIEEVNRTLRGLIHLGIEFKTGEDVGKTIELGRLESELDAVVLAIGAGDIIPSPIPGSELRRVVSALDFLRKVKEGQKIDIGRSVVVVGGGNTALDAAVICRKLGADEVRVVCLERPSEMPAFPYAIEEAQSMGVVFQSCWGPTAFRSVERAIQIELSRCVAIYNEEGEFSPQLDPCSSLKLEAHQVILALGQQTRPIDVPRELLDPDSGRFVCDPLTSQSLTHPKLFISGDCLTGPSSVVHSLASGLEAGISADRFIRRDGLRWGRDFWNGSMLKEYEVHLERAKGGRRGILNIVNEPVNRLDTEIERAFSSEQALNEAIRCLSCGRAFEMNKTCWYCLPCEIECPVNALQVKMPYLVR